MIKLYTFSESGRIKLRDQAKLYRAKYQIRWDQLIAALTFKQYNRLPVNVGMVDRLEAIKAVTKSVKLRALADETCGAWLEYGTAKEIYKRYLELDTHYNTLKHEA